jgi:phage terminase large subunit-like protein
MPTFEFTPKQLEARSMLASVFQFFMLFGGSRSGKTFLAVYAIVIRALKASGSRHAILRFRFNAVKASIIFDTFPKVMSICFPGTKYDLNKTDWIVTFDNGSQIWFGGLDDKERTEKILGQEFATIYLNECSQIPWRSVGIVITRLAQNCNQDDGVPLKLRMLFDCNPPDKNHWTFKVFVQQLDPDTKQPLPNRHLYGSIQMNPTDNLANLPASYIETLEGLPAHLRKRFLEGEFKDANPNALFSEAAIEQYRVEDSADLPDLARVVVGVDPSGADDDNSEGNDAIGIYIAALGVDGNAYLIEDATIKAGPGTWGKMAVSAYHRHDADVMVGEQNFGGAMVKFVIQTADRNVNYKIVNASRGKVQRAEPFSPLFEDGRVRIVGRQIELEEELGGFSTNGYTGEKSPNRADAAIWCLAELFPSVVGKRKKQQKKANPLPSANKW